MSFWIGGFQQTAIRAALSSARPGSAQQPRPRFFLPRFSRTAGCYFSGQRLAAMPPSTHTAPDGAIERLRADRAHCRHRLLHLHLLSGHRPAAGGAARLCAWATGLRLGAGRAGDQRAVRGHAVEPFARRTHGGHGGPQADRRRRHGGLRRQRRVPVAGLCLRAQRVAQPVRHHRQPVGAGFRRAGSARARPPGHRARRAATPRG